MKIIQSSPDTKQPTASPRLSWQTRWFLAAKAAASVVLLGTSPENHKQAV